MLSSKFVIIEFPGFPHIQCIHIFYRFTDEDSAQLNQWRMMSLENTTSYALALKRGQIYYFYIFAITESGELTDRSNYYEYDPEGI